MIKKYFHLFKGSLFSMAAIICGRKKSSPAEYFMISSGIVFLLILVYWGVWSISRLPTMTANSFISRIGAPVLWYQTGIMLAICLLFWGVCRTSGISRLINKYPVLFDVTLFLAVWIVASWVWCSTPTQPQYGIRMPTAPNYEYYPYSDAEGYVFGAESILHGFPNYLYFVDKPFFILYQVLINAIGGHSANMAFYLNTIFLGLTPAVLFLIGKELHSRVAGVGVATLYILKQVNVLLVASNVFMTSNVKTFFSEPLTGLFVALAAWLLIYWLKSSRNPTGALLAGGMVGLATLVRLNPIVLLPIGPLVNWLMEKKLNKKWWLSTGLFLGMFLLTQIPWAIYNQVQYKSPFAYINWKTNGVVVQNRYLPYMYDRNQFDKSNPQPVQVKPSPSLMGSVAPYASLALYISDRFAINSMTNFLPLAPRLTDNLQTMFDHYYWKFNFNNLDDIEGFVSLLLNIVIMAIGIGYAWNRWKFIGLMPLIVNLVYGLGCAITLTAAGFRSTVPVDWAADIYLCAGLLFIVEIIYQHGIGEFDPASYSNSEPSGFNRVALLNVAVPFIFFASLPIIVTWIFPAHSIPTQEEMRQTIQDIEKVEGTTDSILNSKYPGFHFYQGVALNPRFYTAGEGDNTEIAGVYDTRDYSRLVYDFYLYPTKADDKRLLSISSEMPLSQAPGYFPQGSEIIIVTCEADQFNQPVQVTVLGDKKEVYNEDHFTLSQCAPPSEGLNSTSP